jgi:hypothetical protein
MLIAMILMLYARNNNFSFRSISNNSPGITRTSPTPSPIIQKGPPKLKDIPSLIDTPEKDDKYLK